MGSESHEFLLYALVSCLFVIVVIRRLATGRKLNLPPSPRALPLLGHLLLLRSESLHIALQQLCKRYGPVVFLKLGLVPAIAVGSAEVAKEVLKTQDAIFASRPYFASGVNVKYKDIAVAPYGEHWRSVRKLCTLELFTVKRIDSFAWIRKEELRFMLSSFLRSHEKGLEVRVRDVVTAFTFNIMTRIVMSKRYFGESDDSKVDAEAEEFKNVSNEATQANLGFHISDFVPAWLRWIDWTMPEIYRFGAVQDRFMQKIVDEHKKTLGQVNDLTDTMLQYTDDEEVITATTVEMVSAGTDTSAATIEWALAELLRNPRVLEEAQRELEAVIGDRLVEEGDVQRLEYLQAVVKEVLRLHPPVATLIPHMSMQDCKVAGYDVPKGTTVFVNVYAIGRDPELWEHPLEFKPERFLGTSIDVKGQDFGLLPFGSGRRACPGMSLGLRTVHLALGNLLHAFSWSAVGEVSLEDKFALITALKHPLHARAIPKTGSQKHYSTIVNQTFD